MNMWYFSVIKKELSSYSISLKDLLIGFVVMWLKNGSKMKQNYNESLAMSLLEILCSSSSSCSLCSKVCGGSSLGLWRLEFVELH